MFKTTNELILVQWFILDSCEGLKTGPPVSALGWGGATAAPATGWEV